MPYEELLTVVRALEGRPCWYVNAGGAVGTSFSLALGEKIQRESPLRNPSASEEYRQFEGEFGLYVWCSWRLADGDGAIVSSYEPVFDAGKLKMLTGQVVRDVELEPHSLDLKLCFERAQLDVFCDHVFSASSYDCNYELHCPQGTFVVGPGFSAIFEGFRHATPRDSREP